VHVPGEPVRGAEVRVRPAVQIVGPHVGGFIPPRIEQLGALPPVTLEATGARGEHRPR